ncbi:MAG: phosphoribosyltransferase [Alphaproteobacteria bacterium]|nr:phosphoribosyltransferase [Alphaproteobacteria bacterium]
MNAFFTNRAEAGKQLAKALASYAGKEDVRVMALPRGGIPVAAEIAQALKAPLDLMLVRKLGVPEEEELAFGALAFGGNVVFNDDVLRHYRLSPEIIAAILTDETKELLRRNKIYREGRPPPELKNRLVILVDDGAATGADMRAALAAAKKMGAARIVAALPVAPLEVFSSLQKEADEVVCLQKPDMFWGVGGAYEDFHQVRDEEVKTLMAACRPFPAEKTETT